ncbi:hypothetical protein PTTG_05555 [Puccinia triticina 1-1 BBBD Race 1]|uniref:Endoplasmic reticulum-Golgi intermediate compartment protein 3 n=2 Tax=Puccinia triticina TaxID=208348 RepID=A0A180GZY2_PUCT1|nr:uncharacterized protein PtA15_9A435 [Puccinia triticina]OAV98407.1 hypothetical protein PTTG_05555 [Puccinia triticina 1-1 BBBD Race 1]WAQ88308.1 hypothetical protein PtA15_9A435 [Puccinia triticina]WAR60482.1 hypothetical protein PtB15_9B421 [Puccinia triticina]
MGRHGQFGGYFKGLDGFSKTMEDVKVKTGFGGILTMASAALIFTLILVEFRDYRQIHVQPSILVDKSRGEKLLVHMNITFPRVPCYLLSVDVMDISGEHQNDVAHDLAKTRLDLDGVPLSANTTQKLQGELESIIASRAKDYCGSCYGGEPGPSGCCNSCEEVRESYVRRGWSFNNPDGIEQCVQEHWSERIKEQSKEGCNINGILKVNKVIGNFHLSPGRSFQTHQVHVHDLVPYLQDSNLHDFGHVIHNFAFMDANQPTETAYTLRLKRTLGIVNPLDGVKAHTEASNYMFQYFLKVVGTQFQLLDGQVAKTHQYSVTQYERDLDNSDKSDADELGHLTSHGHSGVPGVFFNYEISPMQVVHQEYRQSFAHFATSTCAIVGGVLTVAGLLDSFVYGAQNRMKGGSSANGASHSRTGKFL